MKRPSFQFYPGDWRSNAKLRRCSEAARGAWMDVLCVLHDSEEYGVCRWPLADLARTAGVPLKLVRELADKDVLKGGDSGSAPYVFTPSHAGRLGEPVVLVLPGDGPCWYSSRFVRDEWVRQRRGGTTRFDSDNQPPKGTPTGTPTGAPKATPTRRVGVRQGDGPSSSSSSSASLRERADPYGSGASAPPDPPGGPPSDPKADAAEAVWAAGVPLLTAAGVTERNARSFLGKLRKHNTDTAILAALRRCAAERSGSPVAFLQGCLRVAAIGPAEEEAQRAEALDRLNAEAARRLRRSLNGATVPDHEEIGHA